jgi:hypothetical protein
MGGRDTLGVGLLGHLDRGGGVSVFFDVVVGEEAAEDLLDYADDAVHCVYVCMYVWVGSIL